MPVHNFRELDSLLGAMNLDRVWFVTGTEPLLELEACDAIRAAAQKAGFEDRTVLDMTGRSDWSQLAEAACDVGLFSDKKIIEVRLPSASPGAQGSKAIQEYLKNSYEGVCTIFEIPEADWSTAKSAWYKALSSHAETIACRPVPRSQLAQWIAQRMSRHGQSASRETLEYFADLVEGNLFAARQEIDKLSLLYPEGEVSREDVVEAVSNSSRFETQGLSEAIAGADPEKAARIIDSLKDQGEPVPLLLAILTSFIRGTIKKQHMNKTGQRFMSGVFVTPEMTKAAAEIPERKLLAALRSLADVDRISKGVPAPDRDSDLWLELKSVALFLCRRTR